MTDVPSLAAQTIALALGTRAVSADGIRLRWAIAALLVGVFAFSIRQFAIAAPAALLAGFIVARPRLSTAWLAVIPLVGLLGIAVWQSTLPGQVGAVTPQPGGPARMTASIGSIAIFLAPISLRSIYLNWWVGSRGPSVAAIVATLVILVLANGPSGLFITLENLASPWGAPYNDYIIGGRPEIFGTLGWTLYQGLAAASIFLLADASTRVAIFLGRAFARREPLAEPWSGIAILGAYSGLTFFGLLAFASRYAVFDRYFWPLIIPLGILLLRLTLRRAGNRAPLPKPRVHLGWVGPAVAASLVTAIASLYALNSFAFDAARWRAGEQLVAGGHSPATIDAGYEWVGTYAPGPALFQDRELRPSDQLVWYGNIWPNLRRCAFVAGQITDLEGFVPLADEGDGYTMFLVGGPWIPLFRYESASEPCP